MIRIQTIRRPAPRHLTARDILRRHLHEDGQRVQSLAQAWGIRRFSVWRVFQRTERHLQPHHVEGAITALHLDDFDANELRLVAAREAGWNIDPRYILEDQ